MRGDQDVVDDAEDVAFAGITRPGERLAFLGVRLEGAGGEAVEARASAAEVGIVLVLREGQPGDVMRMAVQERDDVMPLDGFVEGLALRLVPPGAARAEIQMHGDDDRFGRADLGQPRLQEGQAAFRVPHRSLLRALFGAVARVEIDVDEMHPLPVPGGVQGVFGERRHQAGGEHLTIAGAEALAHRAVAPGVMVAGQGEGGVLGRGRTLPRK